MKTAEWQRRASKKYYNTEKGKQVARAASRKYVDKRRLLIDTIKYASGCVRCGIKDSRVLEFHHRDPSTKEFCGDGFVRCSLDRFYAEVEKCNVLCANCHKIVEWARREAAKESQNDTI